MPRLTAAQKTALEVGEVRACWLVRIEFDAATWRFNSTNKDLDYNAETYLGRGYLASVSGASEGVDLRPQQASVSLSGIDRALLSSFTSNEYINRAASISIAIIDLAGEVVSTIPILSGFMTDLSVVYGSESSVKVTIEDQLALWNRPRSVRYTRAEQLKRNPNDKGFNFVLSIENKDIIWPTAEWLKESS